MPDNIIPLSVSPFDVREECLNTTSALLSVFNAEVYYRITPGTPLALNCHANQTVDGPQKGVFLECCSISECWL